MGGRIAGVIWAFYCQGRAVKRLFLPLIAVALVALAAACGGGEDATPTPTARPTARAQLSYIGADGSIWLVTGDGSGKTLLAGPGTCSGGPPSTVWHLAWSPTGDKLACVGRGNDAFDVTIFRVNWTVEVLARMSLPGIWSLYWSPDGETLLFVTKDRLLLTDVSGQTLAELGPTDLRPEKAATARPFRLWAPDGRQIAYWAADEKALRIYSLDSASERTVAGDYRPLSWALDGQALLVAANYREPPPEQFASPSYEVYLLDVTSGQLTRVPQLDSGPHIWANLRQFWVAPNGKTLAVLIPVFEGQGIAMLDLQSSQWNPIEGSIIRFGSDFIPSGAVKFSADSSQLYWVDNHPATVYRANSDGTGVKKMAVVPSSGAALSPDFTMMAYNVIDDQPDSGTITLYIANIDGTHLREIDGKTLGPVGIPFAGAWSPTP